MTTQRETEVARILKRIESVDDPNLSREDKARILNEVEADVQQLHPPLPVICELDNLLGQLEGIDRAQGPEAWNAARLLVQRRLDGLAEAVRVSTKMALDELQRHRMRLRRIEDEGITA